MLIRIEFDTTNDSFDSDPMAEAIRVIARSIESLSVMSVNETRNLYDSNGNSIGYVSTII